MKKQVLRFAQDDKASVGIRAVAGMKKQVLRFAQDDKLVWLAEPLRLRMTKLVAEERSRCAQDENSRRVHTFPGKMQTLPRRSD